MSVSFFNYQWPLVSFLYSDILGGRWSLTSSWYEVRLYFEEPFIIVNKFLSFSCTKNVSSLSQIVFNKIYPKVFNEDDKKKNRLYIDQCKRTKSIRVHITNRIM